MNTQELSDRGGEDQSIEKTTNLLIRFLTRDKGYPHIVFFGCIIGAFLQKINVTKKLETNGIASLFK